jgi:hypothetical protein
MVRDDSGDQRSRGLVVTYITDLEYRALACHLGQYLRRGAPANDNSCARVQKTFRNAASDASAAPSDEHHLARKFFDVRHITGSPAVL